MATNAQSNNEEQETPIVVRDRRRVDPVTGEPRPSSDALANEEGVSSVDLSQAADATDSGAGSAEAERLQAELAERTADLQRITAEYANHRKRVERERERVLENVTGSVLMALFPVLDDIERAREHGDLTGGFATVAEHLVDTTSKLGLATFAEKGDVFDPTWHEAVSHTGTGDTEETVIVEVLRKGYSLGEKMLRPALVVVADAHGGETVSSEQAEPENSEA